jgi:hypothetical protein
MAVIVPFTERPPPMKKRWEPRAPTKANAVPKVRKQPETLDLSHRLSRR